MNDILPVGLGMMALAVLMESTAVAQGPVTPVPPIFEPKREFPLPAPPREPVLPPIPIPPEQPLQQTFPAVRIFIREVRVVGSTVFTADELNRTTAPFVNREVSTEDLEQMRLALTLLYVNNGYVTSGAIIPDQDVTGGVVVVQIIEGSLARVDVEGNRWFRTAYLKDRVALGLTAPLQIRDVQERLQLLQQDRRIERVNAELRGGDKRGESVLNIRVTDAFPVHGWLDFNNYQTPIVGAERGLATVAHQNLTGSGDILSLTYGRSSGVDPILDASYSIPVTRYDTTVSATYRRNAFIVLAPEFESLRVGAQAEIIGLSLRQPVYRTLTDEAAIAVIAEHVHNRTTLLGQPFEFVPGMRNGVGNVSALRFLQEWISRRQTTVISARSRFSVGVNVLGATINDGPVADGQYFAWLGQLQGVRRFEELHGWQLIGRMDLQLTNDRLFPLEQVPVGGRFSVRGYRENQLVRDNAFLASLESRIPIIRRAATGDDILQFAQFVDYGRAWVAKDPTPDPRFLVSVGLGLRWNILPQERARFELYWGVPLNHVDTPGGNLQDHGIHLQLVVQAF